MPHPARSHDAGPSVRRRLAPTLRRFAVALLLPLLAPLGLAGAEGGTYAVLVGVSKYKDPKIEMPYADKDAQDVYALLRAQPQAQESRLKLLTDANATRDNIVKAMESLFSQAGSQDMVVFYFSGHGGKGGFAAHDGPLAFGDLGAAFRGAKAGRKVIFADASHSGSLIEAGRRPTAKLGKNLMLFVSSKSDQASAKVPEWKNGRFTEYLVGALKGHADANRDRVVTARELFDYVHPKVKESSGGSQVPQMWGSFDLNMVVADYRQTPAAEPGEDAAGSGEGGKPDEK
jgi:uncharacterized caspase-like protein